MIHFPNGYFEGETRNDFYIEPMMKCAWAAQQEVLLEIDRICKKNALKYFADYGTLLGAIRHKGFIPWDDDIDIAMLRPDYDRFLEVALLELPEGYKVLDPKTTLDYSNPFARIVNAHNVSYSKERLLKFHGFPFIAGVDIFPIDTIPQDLKEREVFYLMYDIVHACYKSMETDTAEVYESLTDVEEFSGFLFDRTGNIQLQLGVLTDIVEKKYMYDKNDEMTHVMYHQENAIFKREWFEKIIYVPFEQIEIPIPSEYDQMLTGLYGADYMTPKKLFDSHAYPFYKTQYDAVVQTMVERKLKGEKLWG